MFRMKNIKFVRFNEYLVVYVLIKEHFVLYRRISRFFEVFDHWFELWRTNVVLFILLY